MKCSPDLVDGTLSPNSPTGDVPNTPPLARRNGRDGAMRFWCPSGTQQRSFLEVFDSYAYTVASSHVDATLEEPNYTSFPLLPEEPKRRGAECNSPYSTSSISALSGLVLLDLEAELPSLDATALLRPFTPALGPTTRLLGPYVMPTASIAADHHDATDMTTDVSTLSSPSLQSEVLEDPDTPSTKSTSRVAKKRTTKPSFALSPPKSRAIQDHMDETKSTPSVRPHRNTRKTKRALAPRPYIRPSAPLGKSSTASSCRDAPQAEIKYEVPRIPQFLRSDGSWEFSADGSCPRCGNSVKPHERKRHFNDHWQVDDRKNPDRKDALDVVCHGVTVEEAQRCGLDFDCADVRLWKDELWVGGCFRGFGRKTSRNRHLRDGTCRSRPWDSQSFSPVAGGKRLAVSDGEMDGKVRR